jgi:protein phosphatase 1L
MNENINGTGVSMFGVFDGHGGMKVAEFCKGKLFEDIEKKIVEVKEFSKRFVDEVGENRIDEETSELAKFVNGTKVNYGKILTSEILMADQKLVEELRTNLDVDGSTAVIAVLDGSRLTVANVGDSRGVMCDSHGTAIALSFDHKPDGEAEKARIEKAGGFVAKWGVWRVNGILAVSRALGDYYLKPNLVIANPEVLEFDLEQHR